MINDAQTTDTSTWDFIREKYEELMKEAKVPCTKYLTSLEADFLMPLLSNDPKVRPINIDELEKFLQTIGGSKHLNVALLAAIQTDMELGTCETPKLALFIGYRLGQLVTELKQIKETTCNPLP